MSPEISLAAVPMKSHATLGTISMQTSELYAKLTEAENHLKKILSSFHMPAEKDIVDPERSAPSGILEVISVKCMDCHAKVDSINKIAHQLGNYLDIGERRT